MKKFIAFAVLSASFLPFSAFAATATQATNAATTQNTQVNTTAPSIMSCEGFVTSVSARLEKMDSRSAKNSEYITIAFQKLDALITKVKAMGIDTATLEATVADLRVATDKLNVDYAALRAHLVVVGSIDCATVTTDAWQKYLDDGKALFAQVKADVQAIRELNKKTKTEAHTVIILTLPKGSDLKTTPPTTPDPGSSGTTTDANGIR